MESDNLNEDKLKGADNNEKLNKNINVDELYEDMTEIEHILERPGIYVGNIHYKKMDYNLYKPSENKIIKIPDVSVNEGILKLVDEIIQNSIDIHVNKNGLFDVTQIDVKVNTNGDVFVKDNGGILVQKFKTGKHKGMYVPQKIFGVLRSGSNYGNNKERKGAGLNGLGSKLTNIYSNVFEVITCDGENKFHGVWTNNMREFNQQISKTKEHYTLTKWNILLEKFNVNELDISTIRIIQKRCIDAAANFPGLVVNFESDVADGKLNSSWKFDSFKEYVGMHINNEDKELMLNYSNGKDEIVLLQKNLGYDFGFVNGGICSKGTHMVKIYYQLCKEILTILKEKNIDLITKSDIINHCTIFVKTEIINPDYDSQAKDELANKIPTHKLKFSAEFLNNLKKSELVSQLVDYYNIKYVAEQKKLTRKLNRDLKKTKSDKFIKCDSKKGGKKQLWIFEGDSAKGGFRNARDPETQAAYLLRGKIKNVLDLSPTEINKSKEWFEIAAILKLQFFEPEKNLKNCDFTEIVITTDMDHDGSHIACLIFVYFATYFPELIRDGRLYRATSPIIIASKGKQEKLFYTLDDYHAEADKLKGWQVLYKKGLGGLNKRHYEEMVGNPRLEQIVMTDFSNDMLRVWFGKSTEQRKNIMKAESGYFEDGEEIN